ncbi:MAG: hypothetical protein H6559_29135 [Lewinellaceae bacterium]|nr:hypothetical protein [Lewinellaceae bacterium]
MSGVRRQWLQQAKARRPKWKSTFLQKVRDIIQEHLSDASFTVEVLSQSLVLEPTATALHLAGSPHRPERLGAHPVHAAGKVPESGCSPERRTSARWYYATGFDDPKYFSRVFAKEFGVPPSKV